MYKMMIYIKAFIVAVKDYFLTTKWKNYCCIFKPGQIPRKECNTTSWQLASWLVWGWFWTWCRPPWAHPHTPRWGSAWAPTWSRACKSSGAPGSTAPLASPRRWWPPSHNTPLVLPQGDTMLVRTTLLAPVIVEYKMNMVFIFYLEYLY